jgi:hypothetical protein
MVAPPINLLVREAFRLAAIAATVTMNNINTTYYSDIRLVKVGSFSTTALEGLQMTVANKVLISN